MSPVPSRPRKTHFATMTVWAALMAAASMLPSFPVLGGGGNFSIGYTLAPLAGVMFGPAAGAVAAMVGDFIGTLIAPHTANVGIFTCLTGASNALAAGYLSRGNWKPAVGIIVLGTFIWLLYPSAQEAWIYTVTVWICGAVAAVLGGTVGAHLFARPNVLHQSIGLYLIIYPCYIAAQAVNCIFVMILYDLPVDLIKFLAVMVPMERLLFTFAAVVIGMPLLLGLPRVGVLVGPACDSMADRIPLDEVMRKEYEASKARAIQEGVL